MKRHRARPLLTILTSGLVAGVLDILYAFVAWGLRGVSPVRVSQSVAAGLLGREAAVAGGLATAALGLTLHFAIATVMAATYYALATRVEMLVKHAVGFGLAYGLGLYGVMNHVVIPLSAIGPPPSAPPAVILIASIAVHMFGVGLPIALITRRALRASPP